MLMSIAWEVVSPNETMEVSEILAVYIFSDQRTLKRTWVRTLLKGRFILK